MHKLVLIRHGESTWNLENRFTGWTDVGLTPVGIAQAQSAGAVLKANGYDFDMAYTSVLKRATHTLWHCLDAMDRTWLPVVNDWRLNERHYGALQGLNKAETAKQYGDEQVLLWRRSYDVPPPSLEANDPRCERGDIRYKNLKPEQIPLTECLKDTGHSGWQARRHRCARQLHSRIGQTFGRYFGRRHRGFEHSQRHTLGVRAGRQLKTHQTLLFG